MEENNLELPIFNENKDAVIIDEILTQNESKSNEIKEILKDDEILKEIIEEEIILEDIPKENHDLKIEDKENLAPEILKDDEISETTKKNEINVNDIYTGLELKYLSYNLLSPKINSNNFPRTAKLSTCIEQGLFNIQINNKILKDTMINLKIYERLNQKIEVIELISSDFNLSLSIEHNNGNITKYGDYFAYSVKENLKNSKLLDVLEILKDVFNGKNISFKTDKLTGDIKFPNIIEFEKINLLISLVQKYNKIHKKLKLPKECRFSNFNASMYSLFLLDEYLNNNRNIKSWVNINAENLYDFKIGDMPSFSKVHKLPMDFDLKETIKIISPLGANEIRNKKIICTRKDVNIIISKIAK